MNKNINQPKIKMIVDKYFDGLALLNTIPSINKSLFFDYNQNEIDNLKPLIYEFVQQIKNRNYSRNPGLFYALLQLCFALNCQWDKTQLAKYKAL